VTPAAVEAPQKRRGRPPKALSASQSVGSVKPNESDEDEPTSTSERSEGSEVGSDFERLLSAGIPGRRERKARVSSDPAVQERTDYQRGYRSQQRMTTMLDLFKDAPFSAKQLGAMDASTREKFEGLYKEARRAHHVALNTKLDSKGYFAAEDSIRDLLISARRLAYASSKSASDAVPTAPWNLKPASSTTTTSSTSVDGEEAHLDEETDLDVEQEEVNEVAAKSALRIIEQPHVVSVAPEPIEPLDFVPVTVTAKSSAKSNTAALLDIDPDLI
jgi:hypothetical protein